MVIGNRDEVVAGMKLVATYKKQAYVCTVEASEDGKLAFVYDGKSYNSPSSAGTAVIGTSCNGWRFWSVEGASPAQAATETPARAPKAKATAKGSKVFYRIPNQRSTAEGVTRFYCNGCAASFESGTESPQACPRGHRNDDPDLTSAPAGTTFAAEKVDATAE